ncbi:deaminase [Gordonia sp. SID5947]|uniref:dihydrofolate reductase family protein n=1 Tax=Gordonia sp. SID5947 TaxID=2690315 RepID=UPI0013716FC8|nr:dihydrofolate reductase family protein [Gordonia sp. SID5947]MYR05512.1 deaminase [Gordonia sp. SID5947]
MTATYTADIFSTVDGFGAPRPGTWGGYWGRYSTEWLEHRRAFYTGEYRMVFGANTYRLFTHFDRLRGSTPDADETGDAWLAQMRRLPTTVVSTTLHEPLEWPSATLATGDATDVVDQLKNESQIPLRSHGSVSMNRALMAAGLVDRIQLTIFPVITGQTGAHPLFHGSLDFDLELIDSRTFDGGIQELVYRPSLHA